MAGPSIAALVEMGETGNGFVGPGGLILVDVADPDRPDMAARLDLPGVRSLGIVRADPGRVEVVTEEWAPGADSRGPYFQGAFFLSTVDVSDPRAPVVVKKAVLFGAPLAVSDRFVASDGGSGVTAIQSLSATGELTLIAKRNTAGSVQSTAIEGTRAVFTEGNRVEVVDLDPVAAGKTVVLQAAYTVTVQALVGGRAFMATGEVIDLRGTDPQQIAFCPLDSRDAIRPVRVETTAAAGHPVRAYYVGGFRGIQAVPLD
jgi:hypothetical protein